MAKTELESELNEVKGGLEDAEKEIDSLEEEVNDLENKLEACEGDMTKANLLIAKLAELDQRQPKLIPVEIMDLVREFYGVP